MLGLTRKTDYALVALSYLARGWHAGDGARSAREIAERFNLPLPLLMNILKVLSAAGILRSRRGASGGYELAKAPDQTTVLEVVAAMEGPVRFAACCSQCADLAAPESADDCPIEIRCPIREPIRRLHHRITRFLHAVTLVDLLDSDPELFACRSPGESRDETYVPSGRSTPTWP